MFIYVIDSVNVDIWYIDASVGMFVADDLAPINKSSIDVSATILEYHTPVIPLLIKTWERFPPWWPFPKGIHWYIPPTKSQ